MKINRFILSSLAGFSAMLVPSLCNGQVPSYTINTVIGTGTSGYTADGASAATAQLASPFGIAVDSGGNLFITDQVNNRIRKVGTDGSLSTVAGNGTAGFDGDGTSATGSKAMVNFPEGVAVDSSGNLYIADTGNCVIRKVSGGNISTIAGTSGSCGFAGDGVAGTGSAMNTPAAVALDASGNLFIADTKDNLIRKLDTKGVITNVAGNLLADFTGDGGNAKYAALNNPEGVAVDAAGNLYIADTGNHRIRMVRASDNVIVTVAGNGVARFAGDGGLATKASLYDPKGVAVDAAGNLFIADTFNNRVRVVTGGIILTIAGRTAGFSGDGGLALNGQLRAPVSMAITASGSIYVSDNQNHAVRFLTPVSGTALPAIKAGGVVSATAFGGASSVAPGSWIEVYGSNLASGTRSWTNGDFLGITAPTSLDGTKVSIGGLPAFISYISPGQVNAQVASGVATGPQPVLVMTSAGTSAVGSVTVNTTQPALLAKPEFIVGGKQYVTALFPDGTLCGAARNDCGCNLSSSQAGGDDPAVRNRLRPGGSRYQCWTDHAGQ